MLRINQLSCQVSCCKRDFSKFFKAYSTSEIEIRELDENDWNNNFIAVLGQLTKVQEISEENFKKTVRDIKSSPNLHLIIVAVFRATNTIVGAGSIIVEKKFIRNLGKIGHIEDIVVDSSMRGKNLGRIIVDCLAHIVFEVEQTYKVILDCSNKNVPFYEKLNYKLVQSDMGIYSETFNAKYEKII